MKHKIKLAIIFGVEFVAIVVILLLIFFAGKKTHKVVFDLNGGTLLGGDLEQEIVRGSNATPPSVAKDGCYLHSWQGSYKQVTRDVVVRAVWEYETTVGIEYATSEDSNYCEIVRCYPDLRGDVYIGAYYNGKKVLGIRDGAFAGCTGIENVYMLDGIISFGDGVFEGCTNLKSIDLPSTLAVMGDRVFEGCASLERITLPAALETVPTEAFAGCTSLSEVVFNETLGSIGDYAFVSCTSLLSADIPASVRSIGGQAFHGCTALNELTLREGLLEIAGYAFYNCPAITEVILPVSIARIGTSAFGAATKHQITVKTPFARGETPDGWLYGWVSSGVKVEYGYLPPLDIGDGTGAADSELGEQGEVAQ
jgi:hypothetical protein